MTVDIGPLLPGHVPEVDLDAHDPAVAGKYCSSTDMYPEGRILLFMTLNPEENIDDLIDVLIHEQHHAVLDRVEGFDTCKDLDNIVDRTLRLREGRTSIDSIKTPADE